MKWYNVHRCYLSGNRYVKRSKSKCTESENVCNQCDVNRYDNGVSSECYRTIKRDMREGCDVATIDICRNEAPQYPSDVSVKCKLAALNFIIVVETARRSI